MIEWKQIKDLHVNKKLEEMITKWFGVGLFYADASGNIQHNFNTPITNEREGKNSEPLDDHFQNYFFKMQFSLPYGFEYLKDDVAKAVEEIKRKPHGCFYFNTFFPSVRLLASKIEVDGEVLGVVFAYPYVSDQISQLDQQNIVQKLIECGAPQEDAIRACDSLKKLKYSEFGYLKELMSHMTQEVATVFHELQTREERILDLSSQLSSKYRFHNIIGRSKPMQDIYNILAKVAHSEATILIQGENGTGKEMVAKAIHYNSSRKDAVFLAVNCSAFNDNLLDSELFGHVKGSFTGAVKDKRGFFEVANGGTLFLDEIGDMSLSMQVKLLRVLQEGTFLPVGATQAKKVNVRVLAATNRPLKDMIAKGEFREDLYYRINVINVNLPALRERKDDIPVLMEYFLKKKCEEVGVPLKTWAKRTLEKFMDYRWPGNVRELQNEVERLVVLSGDVKLISPELLSSRILESLDANPVISSHSQGSDKPFQSANPNAPTVNQFINTNGSLKDALEELEIYMIREGLKRCNYNKSRLSKELGISRAGLIMKVEKYGLDKRKIAMGE